MRFAPSEFPTYWSSRTLRRFAWYPRRCPESGVTYWLEWVFVHQTRQYVWGDLAGPRSYFKTRRVEPVTP